MPLDGAWAGTAWQFDSWATNAWIENSSGILDTIEDDDLSTAVGLIILDIAGVLVEIEEDDISVAEGIAEIQFVIDILDLDLTIPKADEDPLEQQRILIKNLTLIQQALRNLGQ